MSIIHRTNGRASWSDKDDKGDKDDTDDTDLEETGRYRRPVRPDARGDVTEDSDGAVTVSKMIPISTADRVEDRAVDELLRIT